ncbi:hypothetical protein G6F23_015117 [Rhizopus arrhizus]|nr:hypothetical protein G6F23_015117 [Rhizopus arrhizus]
MRGLIDQDEGSRGRHIGIAIDRQRLTRGECHASDVVHAQGAFGVLDLLQFVDVAMREHRADLRRRQARAGLQQILARWIQRLRIQPAQLGFELARHLRGRSRVHDHIAARHVHVAVQHQRH